MDRGDLERFVALYLPLAAAAFARFLVGRKPRQFAACLLSILWALPTLLIIQKINASEYWWSFPGSVISLHGMPLELLFGWTLLWGVVPQLAFPNLNIIISACVMVAIDCILMPLCRASIHLGPHWLVGESVAIGLVLIPALCIARWTQENSCLGFRAALQIAIVVMLFLFFIPEICFALRFSSSWTPLLTMPRWSRQLSIQAILLLAIPGVGAVVEFTERGQGTPMPYDPPVRLVTSGMYRYCANPMQVSCAMVMLAWASLLHSGWLIVTAMLSIAYSAGIAKWSEGEDLKKRFGQEWKDYRAAVHNWIPRWRPYHVVNPATLYISRTCKPCSQVRFWLEARSPLGVQILDAEVLSPGSILRMRYVPADGTGTVDGVRAMGRALEHLHLGWAICGTVMRLPGIWHLIQLLMDVSGFGPRLIPAQQPEVDTCDLLDKENPLLPLEDYRKPD